MRRNWHISANLLSRFPRRPLISSIHMYNTDGYEPTSTNAINMTEQSLLSMFENGYCGEMSVWRCLKEDWQRYTKQRLVLNMGAWRKSTGVLRSGPSHGRRECGVETRKTTRVHETTKLGRLKRQNQPDFSRRDGKSSGFRHGMMSGPIAWAGPYSNIFIPRCHYWRLLLLLSCQSQLKY